MTIGFAIVGLSSAAVRLRPGPQPADRAARHRRLRLGDVHRRPRSRCCCASRRRTSAASPRAAFQGGFLLGGITGPFLGAPLVLWSLRAPFFFYAATLAVAGVVAIMFLQESRLPARSADEAAPSEAIAAREPMSFAQRVAPPRLPHGAGQRVRQRLGPVRHPHAAAAAVRHRRARRAERSGSASASASAPSCSSSRSARPGTSSDTRGRKPTAADRRGALARRRARARRRSRSCRSTSSRWSCSASARRASARRRRPSSATSPAGARGTSASAYQQFGDAANITAPLVLGFLSTEFTLRGRVPRQRRRHRVRPRF